MVEKGTENKMLARSAFVAMIRDENSDREPFARESIRQHWNGAASGFHDHQVQSRWKDFLAGWQAGKRRGKVSKCGCTYLECS